MRHRSHGWGAWVIASILLGTRGVAAQSPGPGPDTGPETRLIHQPAVSRDHLAFVYGGDLWISDRDGQHPVQLTTHPASEFAPHFSPDGQWLAFSASYDGNTDVYVVPTTGGQPRRLTWHPGADLVTGWSSDGRRVLFSSAREVGNSRSGQLYEVPLEGGFEQKVMAAVAVEGAWSPDGKLLAYRPTILAHAAASGWRQHRGGETAPIWIIDPHGHGYEQLPHVNASDSNPLWIGEDIAFISDRNEGSANLFLYARGTHVLRQLTHESPWDVRAADAYGNTIVYEAGGRLKSVDVATGAVQAIPIHLAASSLQARPQWKDATKSISSAVLSPTGKRVLVTARGEVFSVPAKDGAVRNLTGTPGVRELDGLWSRDGQRVAYLSDAGGVQALVLRDAQGLEPPVRHPLGNLGFLALRAWSPDGRRIAFEDNHLHLYVVDLKDDALTLIDSTEARRDLSVAFSPDGQWLAYTVVGANHMAHIKLHSFASGKGAELADTLVETDNPVFGGSGLLYFTASTSAGPTQIGLDMSAQERPVRRAIYAAVLAADGRSPLPPLSDEEPRPAVPPAAAPATGEAAATAAATVAPTRVDFAGLAQRLVPIPVAERNYETLLVAADGALFYTARKQPGSSTEPPEANDDATADLYRYALDDRSEKLLRSGIVGVSASADGKKLLIATGKSAYELADAREKLDPKPLSLAGLKAWVDPRQEWHQIFDEAWRMEAQYFYDPHLHGLDWQAVRARYEALLPFVQRREDLNELLREMIGEFQVGHNRVSGGEIEAPTPVGVGLLGADYRIENGQYRIQKIYRGDRWNPFLVAPLATAGVDVHEGDAILAVNGRPLDANRSIHALLEGQAEKQVTLTLSADGSSARARTVVVVPVKSELQLRRWDWVERNRATVERESGGRIAYVYLPDTADEGYAYFNRMFFAQIDKQALIVDDRRNSGGRAANYVLDVLSRPRLAGWRDRDGRGFDTPGAAIYGPKAMLIDQDAGSGGDFLPYAFRRLKLGPLIGTRTWGGLIGIQANRPLLDGGQLSVPYFRMYTPEGEWRVENEGVSPDQEVPLDPVAVNEGRDPQLEAAVANVLERLRAGQGAAPMTAPAPPVQLGK
jgi:tricorn protease